MKKEFLLSALALMGFSGCIESDDIFDTETEYGVPLVNYRFMGELTDTEGNPIKGIEVKISSAEDTITTDDKGAFSTDFSGDANGYHRVTFTDVDGTDNGGEFASKQVEVEWDDAETVDSRDVFDLGTIELEPKEEE